MAFLGKTFFLVAEGRNVFMRMAEEEQVGWWGELDDELALFDQESAKVPSCLPDELPEQLMFGRTQEIQQVTEAIQSGSVSVVWITGGPGFRKTTIPGSLGRHFAGKQDELRTLILKKKASNQEVFVWINENFSVADTKEAPFIRAMVTAVCEDTMDRDEVDRFKCNISRLKNRKYLLQTYIDDDTNLELQALYAVQALFVKLNRPAGFMKSYFDNFYDEEIITEETFNAWESSSEEERGKGEALAASAEFFRWLRSAAEETGEEI